MDSDVAMDSDDERYWVTGDVVHGFGADYFDDEYDVDDHDDSADDEEALDETEETTHAAPPLTPLAPPPATLCRFFVLGKCRFGSRCTYSHALPEGGAADDATMATAAATVDCPFFLRGKCKYGQRCRLRHGPPRTTETASQRGDNQREMQSGSPATRAAGSTTEPSNQQDPLTCGICFEDIVDAGKHFGLLSCDHIYCIDCLRSWRRSKDMEADVTRACPTCRLPSNYIVPSLTFCTGDEKKAVVDAYKRHLAIRECKYFDGTFGSCPFGYNCFYAHRNSLGEDIKHLDRPRRSRRRTGSSERVASSFTSGNRGGSRRSGGRRQYPDALSSILERYNEFFRFLESFEWEEQESH